MLKIIECIRGDHEKISRMMRLLSKVMTHMATGKEVGKECLGKIVRFIEIFAEGYHRKKEEDILFPQLAMLGMPDGPGSLIRELTREHDECLGYVMKMKSALQRWDTDPKSRLDMLENMKKFVEHVVPHMEKLNKTMDFMRNRSIDPERERAMMGKFEDLYGGAYDGVSFDRMDAMLGELEEKAVYCD